jgi:hypothetical protein
MNIPVTLMEVRDFPVNSARRRSTLRPIARSSCLFPSLAGPAADAWLIHAD